MSRVVVITGPTATGKTALGVLLAEILGGEVVGADSMQIYRRMDVGTAKPTPEEMRGVPHHMIDVAEPDESYSVSRYAEEAARCVDDIISRGKTPIIVGGTGLYIDALLAGHEFAPAGGGTALRAELSDEYDKMGGAAMLERLKTVDAETAARLHPNDKRRIIRALEVFISTGKSLSEYDAETKRTPPRYEAAKIALTFADRQELYDRIDRRVDAMMAAGLEDEARSLLASGVSRNATSMQAIGYKEILGVIEGRASLAEAAEAVKLASRHYAKRQLSWFRRYPELHWICWGKKPDFETAVADSTDFLKKNNIM